MHISSRATQAAAMPSSKRFQQSLQLFWDVKYPQLYTGNIAITFTDGHSQESNARFWLGWSLIWLKPVKKSQI